MLLLLRFYRRSRDGFVEKKKEISEEGGGGKVRREEKRELAQGSMADCNSCYLKARGAGENISKKQEGEDI